MANNFTPEQIKIIKNHMPTVERSARTFINVFDTKVDDEKEKLEFLVSMIDKMEKDLAEVKNIINSEINNL